MVCRSNKILALEGSGGTKKMIQKVKKSINLLKGSYKISKKRQDTRVDLPTIGLETFKQCKIAGLKGRIVLKHKLNIFLDKRQCVKFADKNKMFILVK